MYLPLVILSDSKLYTQAQEKMKAKLDRKSVSSPMTIFRRISATLYVSWILFESICLLSGGSTDAWRNYVWIEIPLGFFVCFLLYIVLFHVLQVPFAGVCFHGIMITHQLLLLSISIYRIFVGSRYDRVWYGLRLLLIAICALLALNPATGWINDVLGEDYPSADTQTDINR